MKLKVFILVAIFSFSLIPTYSEAKTKAATVESPDPLKDATVNIYCRLKAGKKTISSSGSGVFISDRGVILTNAHVAQFLLLAQEKGRVKGWCGVRTGSPAKETYTASVLYMPTAWLEENVSQISKKTPKGTGENDFALLYVTGAEKKVSLPQKFPFLPIDLIGSSTVEDSVNISGYPIDNLNFSKIRNHLPRIHASSTVTQLSKDYLTLAPSEASSSGVSGGPVTNTENTVLGIVTSKSSSKTKPSLRAITISYINRAIQAQTGTNITAILTENFATRSLITKNSLPADTLQALTNGLLKKK